MREYAPRVFVRVRRLVILLGMSRGYIIAVVQGVRDGFLGRLPRILWLRRRCSTNNHILRDGVWGGTRRRRREVALDVFRSAALANEVSAFLTLEIWLDSC